MWGRQIIGILLLLTALCSGADIYRGIAKIESTVDASISGQAVFSQLYGSECVHVLANITGLSDGLHGFHVHQYGDLTSTVDLSSLGAHFTPTCTARRLQDELLDPPESDADDVGSQCYNDSIHGLPPSNVRQSGDMGNIESIDGLATFDMDLCQDKMSLYDAEKSILGRSVVVHENEDTGEQPFGNAGNPIAAGIIGLYNPASDSATAGDTNLAVPPSSPAITSVMCYLRGDFDGPGLVEQAFLSSDASLTAVLSASSPLGDGQELTRSFHFHEFGDLEDVGEIWQPDGFQVNDLQEVGGVNPTRRCLTFVSSSLAPFVGRTLTVHSGATSTTPTIAAGVCGLANPDASVLCEAESESEVAGSPRNSIGISMVAALSFASFLAALFAFRIS